MFWQLQTYFRTSVSNKFGSLLLSPLVVMFILLSIQSQTFAQAAGCSDPFEPSIGGESYNTLTIGPATIYNRCFITSSGTGFDDNDQFNFTATAGKQYSLEAFNLGANIRGGSRFKISLYALDADGRPIPGSGVQLIRNLSDINNASAVTPPLEARRYGINLISNSARSGNGGIGNEYSFRLLIQPPNSLPESAQGSVKLTVSPNPAERGGRLNYTIIATNIGTQPIRGAYFEAIADTEEKIIVSSVTASRGTVSIRDISGQTNNVVRVDLGTFEPGAKLTVRYASTIALTTIAPNINSSLAALYNIDSQGLENTIAQDEIVPIYFADTTVLGIGGFTLINADTNQPIRRIINGSTLRLSDLPPNFNVRVETTNVVRSVGLTLDGNNRVEKEAPYSLCGDVNGDYNSCDNRLSLGLHTLTATAAADESGSGTPDGALTIQFNLIP